MPLEAFVIQTHSSCCILICRNPDIPTWLSVSILLFWELLVHISLWNELALLAKLCPSGCCKELQYVLVWAFVHVGWMPWACYCLLHACCILHPGNKMSDEDGSGCLRICILRIHENAVVPWVRCNGIKSSYNSIQWHFYICSFSFKYLPPPPSNDILR